jgi:hypothetical protein
VRNRWGWLGAVLLLGVYGLSGCTTGIAEPIFAPDGGERKAAGRGGGAAGRGGRGGNDTNWNPTCPGIKATGPDLADDEKTLGDFLNSELLDGFDCANSRVKRGPFELRDDLLRCYARACAQSQEVSKTNGCQSASWLYPPQSPSRFFIISMAATFTTAWKALKNRTDFCDTLPQSYSVAGIGHYGYTWVIVLAKPSDSRP